jgi:DNA-directed RNA polymerase sigma subunit (sigma70/sigma32)
MIFDNLLSLTGFDILRLPLAEIVEWFLTTTTLKHAVQRSRNEIIRLRYAAAGESLSDLAHEFGISPQRIYQIVHHRRK